MTLLVTSLASGSDGNALVVREGRTAVLVDCGLPLRILEPLLCYAGVHPACLAAILLTHEHSDHTQGAGALARRYRVPVVCNSETRAALERQLKQVTVEELPIGQRASVGILDVWSFGVPHDAAAPVGYCIGGTAFVGVAIDLGSWNDAIVASLQRADLLIVEANHNRRQLLDSDYPWAICQRILGPRGHLDNEQTGELLIQVAADGRRRDVRLAHLSAHANTPADALKRIRRMLATAGVDSMRVGVLPRQAAPSRKGMPVWSSDRLFQQMELFAM